MTARRMVRCTEGHPYDATVHEVCPVCGAVPVRQTVDPPAPVPPPPPRRGWLSAVALGTLVMVVIGGGAGFYLRRMVDSTPSPVSAERTAAPEATGKAPSDPSHEAPKAGSQVEEAAKAERLEAEAEKAEAVKAEAAKAEAAKAAAEQQVAAEAAKAAAEKHAADEAAAKAQAAAKADAEGWKAATAVQPQQTPAEAQREADPRVIEFMTIDRSRVDAARRALAPVDPAASNATLDTIGPPIERQLRLSMFLRAILANERAVQALKAHDYGRMKTLLSAIVSLPPIAPGTVSTAAHRNLAMYFARQGASARDLVHAARLASVAADGGLPSAVLLLVTRPGLLKAGDIGEARLTRFMAAAATQDPQMFEPVFRQKGITIDNVKAVYDSFDTALTRRDWISVISTYRGLGDLRLPVMDMLLSQALILAPDNEGFMDRALVGAVAGGASSYSIGTDLLGYFCLNGLDGVTKDGPNAAGWLIATLFGLAKDDPAWAGSRERYRQAKDMLSPDQRLGVEQLAREFGVE